MPEGSAMTCESFDAIIVGAGQAGPAIAARCSKEGLRTSVIERGHFGGTCLNVGCVPTKTLVASARAMHLARRGSEFGFDAGELRVDMARVKARKDGIVDKSREGLESWMRSLKDTEVIVGEARFVAAATLEVGGRRLTAPRIFLNVGGRSMRRFGAEVTVVERSPQLLPREDPDVAAGTRSILEGEGVRFALASECISLSREGQGIAVGAACGDDRPSINTSHVLLAVGRRPNTEDLGLEAAGIQTDDRGYITVDDQCRTTADGVWAVGDCNGRGAFTHTSWNDHEVVVV